MGDYELLQFSDSNALAQRAASNWLNEIERSSRGQTVYCAALAGGRIAIDFLRAVAKQAGERRSDLSRIHFFWSDERCVPPTDAQSNFALARDALLSPLRIPQIQIHRIKGEDAPAAAAATAERELRDRATSQRDGQPVVDMVFLGLGENAHVASLFPEETEEQITSQAVFRAVVATKPPPHRITMGYPVIAAAQSVWLLASGGGKETALADSLHPPRRTPLGRVLTMRAATRIFTDIRL